jgi:hypothetical protein
MPASFSKAELQNLPDVISAPRFATYLKAASNDKANALALYQWNFQISAAFFVPLQMCEIAIRNGVAEALERVHGENWPWSKGFAQSLPVPKVSFQYNPRTDLTNVAKVQKTTGKVIAELRFAFWQQIFTSGQDGRLWTPHLHSVFPGIAPTVSIKIARDTAHQNLFTVRKLRNRIAHHEPIFNRNLQAELFMLRDMIGWKSSVAISWLDRVEGVSALLNSKP